MVSEVVITNYAKKQLDSYVSYLLHVKKSK